MRYYGNTINQNKHMTELRARSACSSRVRLNCSVLSPSSGALRKCDESIFVGPSHSKPRIHSNTPAARVLPIYSTIENAINELWNAEDKMLIVYLYPSTDSYQYQLQSMWQKCWNTQTLVHNLRFRERGPLKSWRPETMAEAIFSVLKEGLSLSQAARKYDIPYPTFVLYANRVHNMLGPSADGGAGMFTYTYTMKLELLA